MNARKLFFCIVSAGLICTSAPATAQAQSLEDLLVEKGVITRSEAGKAQAAGASRVYYDKGLKFDFPDQGFNFGIFTMFQPRYQFSDNDEKFGLKNTSGFSNRRARIYMGGSALNKEFTFNIMTDLVGTTDDGESVPDLQDAFISWNPLPSTELRMGQYLVPFAHESYISPAKAQIPEFSVTTLQFALFRQPGAGTWWKNEDSSFFMGASMYNGNSTGEGRNRQAVDTNHLGVFNLRWTPLEKLDYLEEGDYLNTASPAFSMGVAYAYGQNGITIPGDAGISSVEDVDTQTFDLDLNFKYKGFAAHGELLTRELDRDSGDSSPLGWTAQFGYFLLPKEFELAARYAYVDCDNGSAGGQCKAGTEDIHEVAVSANYFFWGPSLKAQLAYIHRNDAYEGEDQSGNKIIFQFTSVL